MLCYQPRKLFGHCRLVWDPQMKESRCVVDPRVFHLAERHEGQPTRQTKHACTFDAGYRLRMVDGRVGIG